MSKKDKKDKPAPFVACGASWQEKFMDNKGNWVYVTRYCALVKGHSGRHN